MDSLSPTLSLVPSAALVYDVLLSVAGVVVVVVVIVVVVGAVVCDDDKKLLNNFSETQV